VSFEFLLTTHIATVTKNSYADLGIDSMRASLNQDLIGCPSLNPVEFLAGAAFTVETAFFKNFFSQAKLVYLLGVDVVSLEKAIVLVACLEARTYSERGEVLSVRQIV
jgi:hypothetical protein